MFICNIAAELIITKRYESSSNRWAWWYITVISVVRMLRREDLKFEVNEILSQKKCPNVQ
jgi:hypothetical protein